MEIGEILETVWNGILDTCWMIGEYTPGAAFLRGIAKDSKVLMWICGAMGTRLMPLLIYAYFLIISQTKEDNRYFVKVYNEGKFTKEKPKEYYERQIKETSDYVHSPKRVIIMGAMILSEIIFVYIIL